MTNYHVTPGIDIWVVPKGGVTATGTLLGSCANDELPTIHMTNFSREITTSRYGDTIDEVLHTGRACTLTITLNKWDASVLKQIMWAPWSDDDALANNTRYSLAGDAGVGYISEAQSFSVGYNVPYNPTHTGTANVWDEYNFPICYLADDGIQTVDIGNEAARTILTINVLRDLVGGSAVGAFYSVEAASSEAVGPINNPITGLT